MKSAFFGCSIFEYVIQSFFKRANEAWRKSQEMTFSVLYDKHRRINYQYECDFNFRSRQNRKNGNVNM